MAVGFPVKDDYATGDVLTAANMNDFAGTLNFLDPTAKGDLFPASSATDLTRLAVGANNSFLRANSSQATGLEWAGTWVDYTPTYSNFTLGNGTVIAKFMRVGNTVIVRVKVTLGSTSVVSTFPLVSAPTNIASNQNLIGQVFFLDAGTATFTGGVVSNGNNLQINTTNVGGTYAGDGAVTATVPFTWTTSDVFSINAVYEAA